MILKAFSLVLPLCASASLAAAAEAPHSFLLTYRDFGAVQASGAFRPGEGYAVRFEGCYAKKSVEAICGFTVRAARALSVTNRENLSHASGADGTPVRTCCVFVQGEPQGYPISPAPEPPAGVAVLTRALKPGETQGFLLRVPNYRAGPPVAAITFSRGEGDRGVTFPTQVAELP